MVHETKPPEYDQYPGGVVFMGLFLCVYSIDGRRNIYRFLFACFHIA